MKKEYPQTSIQLRNISKHFGEVKANHNININLASGRITALLGENGAGKSTLMSILSGKISHDSGDIIVNGNSTVFRSPKDALEAGIGMVYQHFMLVKSMTVAENIFLGQADRVLNYNKMSAKVSELAKEYNLEIDPNAYIYTLSMGERQRVEILKLLYRNSNVLIFDEPTASLTPSETEQLFESLKVMAKKGKAIVFISHKMQEVLQLAHEVIILRRGEVVDTFPIAEIPSEAVLAERMIGRKVLLDFNKSHVKVKDTVLEVKNLYTTKLNNLNFSVRRGEIVAILGVAGNGQQDLVEIITGLCPPPKNNVFIMDKSWEKYFPTPPKMNGLAYIPEDRQGVATCISHNLVDNFLLTNRHSFTRWGFLGQKQAKEVTQHILQDYDVKYGHINVSASMLSGGNLQKIIIGRELYRNPSLIVAENPTQGLDINATESVWSKLLEARLSSGILLVSSDLTEVLAIADRIGIIFKGQLMDIFSRDNQKKVDNIGLMMAGVKAI